MRFSEATFAFGVRVDVVGERVSPDFLNIQTFSPFVFLFIWQLGSHQLALAKLAS